ncbi:hypothetical protein F4677DRAFT_423772 [Hypoxylon crocopeplum]|nr:hypothetical protein F4677DRAFT_423772 [Hypoxylon crocopeplum]
MQGDIFHMEQTAAQAHAHAHATQFEHSRVPLDSETNPQVAIYNEDDLSHLLYANHLHHNGHKDKVIVNHVYRDGYSTPLESLSTGTQTPLSETNETPVLSDCESDLDEGAYLPFQPTAYSRRDALRFEDGFEFPVFLGRQAEESLLDEAARPSMGESDPASKLSLDLKSESEHVRIAAPEHHNVSDISGPLMSWWPEPLEMMEHEWLSEEAVTSKSSNVMLEHHVSSIGGPLMSWWPAPLEILEHEWDERFYE